MRLDRIRDFSGLAVMQRVVPAHGALEFRELADHCREQVGFGKPSRAFREARVCAQLARNLPRKKLDAGGALQLGAELVVIDDLRETRHARFQLRLAVLVVEKARVFEARTDHALVAADDVAWIGHDHVRHDEEFRQQLARGIEEREILLVLPHREDEALLRDFEEPGFELADVDRGVLDQRGDLVEQVGVFTEARRCLGGFSLERLVDHGLALGKIGDHAPIVFQARFVFVGRGERDFARGHEAVPERGLARFETEHAAWDNARAMHHHQLVHRANELRIAVTPAHYLGDGELFQCVRHDRREHLVECRTGDVDSGGHHDALGRFLAFERFDGDAVLLRKTGDRGGGRFFGRAGFDFLAVGGFCADFRDQDADPARRGENTVVCSGRL